MNSTIYIRKENEARWDSITDKSAWVNAYLEKSPPNSIVERDKLEPTGMITSETPLKKTVFPKKSEATPVVAQVPSVFAKTKSSGFCKHGMHPEFCKHAKPGKPCK